ncbi:flagellar protein FlaG [Anaerobacillus sp. CMMVII]|uniref:flagellar protein FlaG n=1 Tax=Anaerobacillus sp. CMMVII TaxID=2755588 RepID=UPI0021B74075|nr:flagellar protein FlaG [Anaerobacillus sp. CMMVII]MCT8140156.1 flagellar protein FlaG [Anaerobacillus sp. CMMVII]
MINQRLTEKREVLHAENAKEISRIDLEKNIENVNKFLETSFTSLKFQVHEDLDRIFVEIVDQITQEVVREIPPKEFLDMISSMLEHVGLIVDKRV